VNELSWQQRLELARRLNDEVLAPLKTEFVGKDEVIDLLGVSLVAGENLFILGPPGTAKSALVQELAGRMSGGVFDYLLTRFTEPNELFGPFDIRKLREGELVTNTEGMLPEADFVFLDELLNANSAILNSLLMVLNERVFRRGRETRKLATLMVVGASNRLPEDDALQALFDRFLLRVHCDNVPGEQLSDVLSAGWQLDRNRGAREHTLAVEDIRQLQRLIGEVDIDEVRPTYVALVARLRQAGIPLSDRRAVKLQRLLAASALLCGRLQANATDLWVLRYIWDREEQREILDSLVEATISAASEVERAESHPRSGHSQAPDAESALTAAERAVLRDQLGVLAARCQWVAAAQQRTYLEQQVDLLWRQFGDAA
jgi:MoxR-like ATPase